jgi:hypothetical protein
MSTLPPQPSPYLPPPPQTVVVTDVNMSIPAIFRFMIKWAIASIPALILLWLLMFAATMLLALIFRSAHHLL